MIKIPLFLFVVIISFSLSAKESLIRPKAYLDVLSGKMIYHKIIRVKNQKIVSIEDDNKNLKGVIDLLDIYLIPGLMDCHTHILFSQTLADKGFEGALLREGRLTDNARLVRAKIFLKQYLAEGFTGLCDLGNSGSFLDFRLRQETAPGTEFPLLYISGPGIAAFKGQFAPNDPTALVTKEYSIVDSQTNIEKLLNIYVNKNVDILKLYLDNSPGINGLNDDILNKILASPQIKKFKKITFHAIEKSSLDKAIRFKLQSLEHATQMSLVSDYDGFLKFVTPTDQDSETLIEFDYFNKYFYESQKARLKALSLKKAALIFGPDFYFHKEENDFNRAKYVKRTLKAYIEAGVPHLKIIRALTLNPAKSLQQEGLVGVILPGRFANMVGFKKNPLEKIEVLMETPLVINRGVFLK